MTDQPAAALDDALEQVIAAARAHLTAVKAADGAIDDEEVWRTYVALNNLSYAYDQLLLDTYGEVTPWDTEEIDLAEEGAPLLTEGAGEPADPHPSVVSVRQRRDYRVPSVSSLLVAAEQATRRLAPDDEVPAPQTVADAMLTLVQAGDGSLASLDLPVLEPLEGVVTVTEVVEPLDLATDDEGLFRLSAGDRQLGRLEEQPYTELDDLDDDIEPFDLDEDVENPDGRSGQ